MRVEVYWNLHKHVFSVRALEGMEQGLVIAHVKALHLSNARFVVQPAGRAKVLREKKKNVHAFVRGEVEVSTPTDGPGIELTYNPFKYDAFVTRHGEHAVVRAGGCDLTTIEQDMGKGCDPVRKARIQATGLVELR